MPLIIPASGAKVAAAFSVANSCRFNDGDATHMYKAFGTPTSLTTWTMSAWVKRGVIGGANYTIWGTIDNGDTHSENFRFNTNNTMQFSIYTTSQLGLLVTTQVFRDPSAWYHLVVVWDSTNGTAGDRMRMYVNGVEVTAFGTDTNPDQNLESYWNSSGSIATIGSFRSPDGSSYVGGSPLDSYLAEVCFIDGQALAPTSFGEFDEDSPTIWKPINVSGLTFGNNGFYLDFEDADNLGNDANGGTDLTEVNLAAVDQATDTPTNNFCTMNPISQVDASGGADQLVYSEGNCQVLSSQTAKTYSGATMAPSAGKWYYELTLSHTGNKNSFFGVRSYDENWGPNDFSEGEGDADILDGWFFKFGNNGSNDTEASGSDGYVFNNKAGTYSSVDAAVTYANDQVVGINLDLDNGDTYLQINGSDLYSGNSVSDLRADQGFFYTPALYFEPGPAPTPTTTSKWNFGGCPPFALSSAVNDENGYGNFEYAPKSGYLAICSKNLGSDGG